MSEKMQYEDIWAFELDPDEDGSGRRLWALASLPRGTRYVRGDIADGMLKVLKRLMSDQEIIDGWCDGFTDEF